MNHFKINYLLLRSHGKRTQHVAPWGNALGYTLHLHSTNAIPYLTYSLLVRCNAALAYPCVLVFVLRKTRNEQRNSAPSHAYFLFSFSLHFKELTSRWCDLLICLLVRLFFLLFVSSPRCIVSWSHLSRTQSLAISLIPFPLLFIILPSQHL